MLPSLRLKQRVGDFENIRGERKDSKVQGIKLDLRVSHIKIDQVLNANYPFIHIQFIYNTQSCKTVFFKEIVI